LIRGYYAKKTGVFPVVYRNDFVLLCESCKTYYVVSYENYFVSRKEAKFARAQSNYLSALAYLAPLRET
jgi:hypothetical protein